MQTLQLPKSLTEYSLTETVTSGQTFRWLVAPTQSTPKTPLSNPNTNTFYLPTVYNSHNFVYKVTQESSTQLQWTTLGDTPINTDTLQTYLRKRLGLDYDYQTALSMLQSTDKPLSNTITPSLSIVQDEPFETTISFICSPQATINRIYTMQRNIERQYGTKIDTEDGVFYTFPTPEQLATATDDELQDCNLGYRASYVRKTAERIHTGEITLPTQSTAIQTDELRDRLQECVGVGPKVADCILLYSYHRTSVIPVDTRIQQMVQSRYDETADTPVKAKSALNSVWPTEFGGYYQLLLYDLAAEELTRI